MKRGLLFTALMVLGLSLSVSAFSATVDGGYLFGDFERSAEGSPSMKAKALAGYSLGSTEYREEEDSGAWVYTDDRKLNGFVIGGQAELPLGPVTLRAS